MAVVILGGLVTSTLLNLFVDSIAVPALRQIPSRDGHALTRARSFATNRGEH